MGGSNYIVTNSETRQPEFRVHRVERACILRDVETHAAQVVRDASRNDVFPGTCAPKSQLSERSARDEFEMHGVLSGVVCCEGGASDPEERG